MGHDTISAPMAEGGPKPEVEPRRGVRRASRGGRFVLIAVALSVGIHVVAALLLVSLPRFLPTEVRPQEQGMVELLMVEQKGSQASQPKQSSDSKPAPTQKMETAKAEPSKAAQSRPETPKPEAKAAPAPPVAEPGDEPVPLEQQPTEQPRVQQPPTPQPQPQPTLPQPASAKPSKTQLEQQAIAQPPTLQQPQDAPVFNLEGTESESNAIVLGGNVLPAMRDDRFRNRPPIYPVEAEIHNQHGSVVVIIHVSANGTATGVDIMESSGVDVLDQAAVDAVRKWHFHPAMQGGEPVPFDMPFRFVFEPY